MGLAGVSVYQLAIILLIVVVLFGTKRLKFIGEDLGGALKSFRRAMSAPDESDMPTPPTTESGRLLQDERHSKS